jgi:hypothetical protein
MMTDDEVEIVAAELAKAGGLSWHSGEKHRPVKLVMDRYRDRARIVIAALDRLRAAKHQRSLGEIDAVQTGTGTDSQARPGSTNAVSVGSLVLYRPPGDKRTYPCRVQRVEGSRVYLVPELPTCTGWMDLANLSSPAIQ